MRKILLILLIIQSCGFNNSIDKKFELSFHNGWNLLNSYKLENNTIYYSHITQEDTLTGEIIVNENKIDSIKKIIIEVISDSVREENLHCFDCGMGIAQIGDKEYTIKDKHELITKLYQIDDILQVKKNLRKTNKVNVESFKTIDILMKKTR